MSAATTNGRANGINGIKYTNGTNGTNGVKPKESKVDV